jgi:hypothetical protein
MFCECYAGFVVSAMEPFGLGAHSAPALTVDPPAGWRRQPGHLRHPTPW